MSEIDHQHIERFLFEQVALPSSQAMRHRMHANALIDNLRAMQARDSDFPVVKLVHVDAITKGTALRAVTELDVMAYVRAGAAPSDEQEMVAWLADHIQAIEATMDPTQIVLRDHCVSVRFRGTLLPIDVSAVFSGDNNNDYGLLVRKTTGRRILTSVPRHLEFLRARRNQHGEDLVNVMVLTKWWARTQERLNPEFRFETFLNELIWCHLVDRGTDISDYQYALEQFFTYLCRSGLSERIAFADYYPKSRLPARTAAPVEVLDPANAENNVAALMTNDERRVIVAAAAEALDALCEGRFTTSDDDAVADMRLVLGATFRGAA